MKKITALLFLTLLTTLSLRADVIFQDDFNYPNGLVETDGLWQVYTPTIPVQDCFVTNNLMILNSANSDAVAAQFTNDLGSSIIYASFTINVSTLPTQKGGYFEELQDTKGNYAGRVFIATTNTVVPGTYQLGVDNFSPYGYEANYYPLDLATGITYQVVFSFDTNDAGTFPNGLPSQGATLAINPAVDSDFYNSPAYGIDKTSSAALLAVKIARIGFSQYTGQGTAGIGNVVVGTSFSDVMTSTPKIPVIGVQPASTNIYSYNPTLLTVAASGLGQLTYQWLSNNVPMVDDGVTVTGSQANVLTLLAPTNTASYSVMVGNSAGTTNSQVAVVTVDNSSAVPHFTLSPTNITSSVSKTVTLTATAAGTGPLSYTWYYEPLYGGGFSAVYAGQSYTLANLATNNSGYYYVNVTGGVGSVNSATVTLTVLPPATVSIGYLHTLLTTNSATTFTGLGSTVYNIQGVVTAFGPLNSSSSTYSEFAVQDNTGGAIVYIGASGTNYAPPAGTLVSINGTATVFDGYLEFQAVASGPGAATNGYSVISNNVPLPAPQLFNFQLAMTNPTNAYTIGLQTSLATLTNVYFYSSIKGAAVKQTATYYTNSYTKLYATEGPYGTPANNTNCLTVFVAAYGGIATNFWGLPEPGQAYQVTGVLTTYNYKPPAPGDILEMDVTRVQDIVTTPPTPFVTGITSTNGVSTLTWPAQVGSTYSVLSATNLLGPWTPAFGLSYYPSTGTYTVTNGPAAGFYRVTTP